MRCRQCSYELWNMVPGRCPECGRIWSFEEYRFRPRLAQFLCPHCETAYAGTDERGLPTPREFPCRSCGKDISLGGMRALPAPGTDGADAMDDEHLWTVRRRIGRFRAWRKTVWQSLVAPRTVGRTLPEQPRFVDALLLALINAFVATLSCGAPLVVLAGAAIMFGGGSGAPAMAGLGVNAGALLLVPVGLVATAIVWGCVTHLILRATGPVKRPLIATVAITLYSTGPFVLSAPPCVGIYLSWISAAVMANTMTFALSAAHRVSLWRSALASWMPCVVTMILGAFGLYWMVMTIVGSMPAPTLVPVSPVASVPSDPNALPGVASETPEEQEPADDELPAQPEPDPE
ncbi:MAG: YIP1 family protein [Phycisphaerales bacterium]|nr:YIP1 family protein [Phycisphaerales bacterium]